MVLACALCNTIRPCLARTDPPNVVVVETTGSDGEGEVDVVGAVSVVGYQRSDWTNATSQSDLLATVQAIRAMTTATNLTETEPSAAELDVVRLALGDTQRDDEAGEQSDDVVEAQAQPIPQRGCMTRDPDAHDLQVVDQSTARHRHDSSKLSTARGLGMWGACASLNCCVRERLSL
jgi:hypothetical protein